MSNIVLSAGVRQNLLALQNTAALMGLTQNRLATGKAVNSALDNPLNFFTSQALNNRAGDLNALLDAVGQAQQTLKAADDGITALTKQVEALKAVARQAQQAASPTTTFELDIAGGAIAADTAATATSANDMATVFGGATESEVASIEIDIGAAAIAALNNGETLSITYDGTTHVFEYQDDPLNYPSGPGANIGFTDGASLEAAIQNAFGSSVAVDLTGDDLTITGTGYTAAHEFTTGGTGTFTIDATGNDAVDGSVLTVTVGADTATFRYVGAGDADPAAGTFNDLTELQAALAASSLDGAITLADAGGDLTISAVSASTLFTVGGDLGDDFGFASTAYHPANANLGTLVGESLTIRVGAGEVHTFNFTAANANRAALESWLDNLDLGDSIQIGLDADNQIAVESTSSQTITFGGGAAVLAAVGLEGDDAQNPGLFTPDAEVVSANTLRANLQNQYNELLVQIDGLAHDAYYQGINLLNGDNLKVVFNEDGSSFLDIAGVDMTSAGLGLTALTGDEFQIGTDLEQVIAGIDTALATLRSQASHFGSNLTTVQIRQDFTKTMINTLKTGADNLVLADPNEEGANLLALQTRQQLSATALSMAAQADQAVLRLFG